MESAHGYTSLWFWRMIFWWQGELWVCLSVIWKWNLICIHFCYNLLSSKWTSGGGRWQVWPRAGVRIWATPVSSTTDPSFSWEVRARASRSKKSKQVKQKSSSCKKIRWWTRGRFTTQPLTVGVRPQPDFAGESVDLALPLLGASCLGWVFSHDLGRSHIIQCCVRNVIQSDWFYTSSVTSCSFDL